MEISLENFYVENYPAERISLNKGKVELNFLPQLTVVCRSV